MKRDWGTFKLADRIAAKVKAGEPLNYVFSYQASGIPLFSPQYQAGAKMGCEMAQGIYPMNCTEIAPVQNDANQQVAQIEAKLAAGEIDCIGIEPVDSNSLTAITNKLMDEGIPVFTAGVPSNGNEFTRFTQIPMKEGAFAAEAVLKWIKDNNKTDIKVFAVSGGDPTQEWAQGRMISFEETIKAAIPDATFVTGAANGLNTSYEPGQTYDVYRSFLTANPNVQFIENVDIGAEHAGARHREPRPAGQGLHGRLELVARPARRHREGHPGRAVRPALARPGRLRRGRLRGLPEERRDPAQHADAEGRDEGRRRAGARGTEPHDGSVTCYERRAAQIPRLAVFCLTERMR